jgi:hypothetical protein
MIPATIRNRNPGAIYPGPSAKRFGGVGAETLVSEDGVHPIVRFPTKIHGAAAMFHNLFNAMEDKKRRRYYYRERTLQDAITNWCGKIKAQSYLALVKQLTGLVPGHVLTEAFLRDPDRVIPLAKAMARHEAGENYPLDDMQWLEAHVMAFGTGKAPSATPNNDVPTMRPEARKALENAQTAAAAVKVGAAVVGGGSAVAVTTQTQAPNPVVPVPPAPDLSNLSEWQYAVQTGKGLALFAYSHILWIAAAAVLYWFVCHYWPKRSA